VRILFVNETCGYLGGVEQNIASTVKGLSGLGMECFLAYGLETGKEPAAYRQLFSDSSLCTEIAGRDDTAPGNTFEEILEQFRPEVIYLHKISSARFCIPYIGKIRVIRMIHDHDLCCPRHHKYFFHSEKVCEKSMGFRCYLDLGFLAKEPGKKIPKFSSIQEKFRELTLHFDLDALLVGSNFMMKELLSNGFLGNIVHIVPPLVPFQAPKDLTLTRDPEILFVGQLIKGKGVDLLLKSLSSLSIPFHATIIGTGNAQEGLLKLCYELGLHNRVTFKGWIPNEEIGKYYAQSRVVVVPSRWPEPFGMIGLEAMHYGRPVVAFGVGGIPDWLTNGKTGLLVGEQNLPAMTKALERILTDWDLASEMSRNAMIAVEERFAFSDYLQNIIRLLNG
jgi:glycosyltransferase involved in cell wall biosynthesis